MHDPDTATEDNAALDRLLNALSVDVQRCVVCSIPNNARARFEPIDAVTVHYVVAGTGFFQLGNAAALPLGPESIVIAPAKTLQFWASHRDAGDDTHGRERCTSVDDKLAQLVTRGQSDEAVSIVRSEIQVTTGGIAGFFDHLRQPVVERFFDNDAARQIFELMIAELAQPAMGSHAIAETLMKAFLVLMLRRHLRHGHASSSVFVMMSDPRLARAMIDVLERPEQPHTLESLAAAAGMSRTVFADRFREVFAQSPTEFIQEFRLKFAAHLLKTTSLPVKAIAVSVGYSSRSYFSRAFRSAFAADPSAYREAHRPRLSGSADT
ncbi:helix-turn-helix domain-containing protein [uncultured Bradyrhizobium sp.]|uniref:helix-turn-helix domain-containing protein n=1 Tax=uncultured Bradyrhizobium sp. TaxID=199684 RepID=UPI0035C9DA44